MLNVLRRVTSEGYLQNFQISETHSEGSSINLRKRQNKRSSLRGAVLTSLGDLVEFFH